MKLSIPRLFFVGRFLITVLIFLSLSLACSIFFFHDLVRVGCMFLGMYSFPTSLLSPFILLWHQMYCILFQLWFYLFYCSLFLSEFNLRLVSFVHLFKKDEQMKLLYSSIFLLFFWFLFHFLLCLFYKVWATLSFFSKFLRCIVILFICDFLCRHLLL